ncbi:MAG: glutamate-1-semialdehyde 2,1-aminomutase [Actinomycetaceae bacterium]|nr:glutamate-1-semialdehyde 2,1-aminomutase [Actinomycetaceae bacterium]
MNATTASNSALFAQAQRIIPGGVDSPVRAFRSVGGTPAFIQSAKGSYITDVEGNERVDLVCSWGPALLGHAHPQVVAAVQEAAARGLSFGAPTEAETTLAELVRDRFQPAEKVRFVSTGTEATMTALRLARGATGRDLLVKFAGNYHGHSDGLLAAAGSGLATGGLPGSAGVPEGIAGLTLVLPYNDEAALEECFAKRGEEIAGVIVESAPCNMGVVKPAPGFNAAIRRLTSQYGAVMIVDEVLTGFRSGPSGYWGLEGQQEGWAPDIFTFGKVVGGGMPLAALGGRAEVMDLLAPLGPVYQAGTLSGNPLATAAGIATLRLADDQVYERLAQVSTAIREGLSHELSALGIPFVINQVGTIFSLFFGKKAAEDGVHNYADAQATEVGRYTPFFWSMFEQGVNLAPSVYEAWFVSAAHDDQAVNKILDALPAAARAAADWKP